MSDVWTWAIGLAVAVAPILLPYQKWFMAVVNLGKPLVFYLLARKHARQRAEIIFFDVSEQVSLPDGMRPEDVKLSEIETIFRGIFGPSIDLTTLPGFMMLFTDGQLMAAQRRDSSRVMIPVTSDQLKRIKEVLCPNQSSVAQPYPSRNPVI
jgi:hypothetical protein